MAEQIRKPVPYEQMILQALTEMPPTYNYVFALGDILVRTAARLDWQQVVKLWQTWTKDFADRRFVDAIVTTLSQRLAEQASASVPDLAVNRRQLVVQLLMDHLTGHSQDMGLRRQLSRIAGQEHAVDCRAAVESAGSTSVCTCGQREAAQYVTMVDTVRVRTRVTSDS